MLKHYRGFFGDNNMPFDCIADHDGLGMSINQGERGKGTADRDRKANRQEQESVGQEHWQTCRQNLHVWRQGEGPERTSRVVEAETNDDENRRKPPVSSSKLKDYEAGVSAVIKSAKLRGWKSLTQKQLSNLTFTQTTSTSYCHLSSTLSTAGSRR